MGVEPNHLLIRQNLELGSCESVALAEKDNFRQSVASNDNGGVSIDQYLIGCLVEASYTVNKTMVPRP